MQWRGSVCVCFQLFEIGISPYDDSIAVCGVKTLKVGRPAHLLLSCAQQMRPCETAASVACAQVFDAALTTVQQATRSTGLQVCMLSTAQLSTSVLTPAEVVPR